MHIQALQHAKRSVLLHCQMLDTLLTTIVREMQNDTIEGRKAEAKSMARRFVRSVARIFVVFNAEMVPQSNKKKQ